MPQAGAVMEPASNRAVARVREQREGQVGSRGREGEGERMWGQSLWGETESGAEAVGRGGRWE